MTRNLSLIGFILLAATAHADNLLLKRVDTNDLTVGTEWWDNGCEGGGDGDSDSDPVSASSTIGGTIPSCTGNHIVAVHAEMDCTVGHNDTDALPEVMGTAASQIVASPGVCLGINSANGFNATVDFKVQPHPSNMAVTHGLVKGTIAISSVVTFGSSVVRASIGGYEVMVDSTTGLVTISDGISTLITPFQISDNAVTAHLEFPVAVNTTVNTFLLCSHSTGTVSSGGAQILDSAHTSFEVEALDPEDDLPCLRIGIEMIPEMGEPYIDWHNFGECQ